MGKEGFSLQNLTLLMRFGLVALFIATGTFSELHAAEKKLIKLSQKKDVTLTFNENPFIRKCGGIEELPQFEMVRATLEEGEGSEVKTLAAQFRLKKDSPVSLKVADQVIPMEKDSSNTYHFILVEDPSKPRSQAMLVISGKEPVQYNLSFDSKTSTASLTPELTYDQKKRICLKNQAWLGLGMSAFIYDQSIASNDVSAKFTSLAPGSFQADIRKYATESWGFLLNYINAVGTVDRGGVEGMRDTSFNWSILGVATQYRRPTWLVESGNFIIYPYARLGLQQHALSRLAVDSLENKTFEKLNLTNGFIGAGVSVFDRKKYFFEAFLDYQIPLNAQGYAISRPLMVDGAIGIGRALTDKLVVGAYWHGHAHNFDYQAKSGADTHPGNVRIIFSNLDFRLGIIF